VCFDDDESCQTLEPQLLKANSLAKINAIIGRSETSDESLLAYMKDNKTECALRFFESSENWNAPEYIKRALR
jgi:hypothetical protein